MELVVTAADGITDARYTIVFERASNDTPLRELRLPGIPGLGEPSGGDGRSIGVLEPAFDPENLAYRLVVPFEIEEFPITPFANDGAARISVRSRFLGPEAETPAPAVPARRLAAATHSEIGSGDTSLPVRLGVGRNDVQIDVTASDAVTGRTYSIEITRLRAGSALAWPAYPDGEIVTTLNEKSVELTPPVSESDGAITYASGDPAVATVDAETGLVRLVCIGATVITATQAATADYDAASVSVALLVGRSSTTTTIEADPPIVGRGQSVRLTAAVLPASASGDVQFLRAGTVIGTATLQQGKVAIRFDAPQELGEVTVEARYRGDSEHSPNTGVLTLEVSSPSAEFEKVPEDVEKILGEEATRSTRSHISANLRLLDDARRRFLQERRAGDRAGERAGPPAPAQQLPALDGNVDAQLGSGRFDFSGKIAARAPGVGGGLATFLDGADAVFLAEGSAVRTEEGTTTLTLASRTALEQLVSDDLMLGGFLGVDISNSDIAGALSGTRDGIDLSLGVYAVRALTTNLLVDGFVSAGAGFTDLELKNEVLGLDGRYAAPSVTLGSSLAGAFEAPRAEIWPRLQFAYGAAFLDDVSLDARAFGQVEDVEAEAGTATLALFSFEPEFRLPLSGDMSRIDRAALSVAPRVGCERRRSAGTSHFECGHGLLLGLFMLSADKRSRIDLRGSLDNFDSFNSGRIDLSWKIDF